MRGIEALTTRVWRTDMACSPLLTTSFGPYREHIKMDQESKALTRELGRPEDIAETFVGLMRNRNITAATVITDGGVRFV